MFRTGLWKYIFSELVNFAIGLFEEDVDGLIGNISVVLTKKKTEEYLLDEYWSVHISKQKSLYALAPADSALSKDSIYWKLAMS